MTRRYLSRRQREQRRFARLVSKCQKAGLEPWVAAQLRKCLYCQRGSWSTLFRIVQLLRSKT